MILEEYGHVVIPDGVTITVSAELIEAMSNATSKTSQLHTTHVAICKVLNMFSMRPYSKSSFILPIGF